MHPCRVHEEMAARTLGGMKKGDVRLLEAGSSWLLVLG